MTKNFYKRESILHPLHIANGKVLEYTHTLGDRAIIETEEGSDLDKQLAGFIGRGGISRITEADAEDLKKNGKHKPLQTGIKHGVKLADQNPDPFRGKQATDPKTTVIMPPGYTRPNAETVLVPGSARVVEAKNPAVPAVEKVISKGKFKPRTGKLPT